MLSEAEVGYAHINEQLRQVGSATNTELMVAMECKLKKTIFNIMLC